MPYAYQWLDSAEKAPNMIFECEENQVEIKIGPIFVYKKESDSTKIECKFYNKWIEVDEPFEDVLYEDLNEFIKNKKFGIEKFDVIVKDNMFYTETVEPVLMRCFKEQKIKVKEFIFELLDVKEAVSLVILSNSNYLESIAFRSLKNDVFGKSDDFLPLASWLAGRRLELHIRFREMTQDKAAEVKKALHLSSLFRIVFINYSKAWARKVQNVEPYFAPFECVAKDEQNFLPNNYMKFSLSVAAIENVTSFTSEENSENWLMIFGLRDYMEIILSKLDFFTMHKLRKVCRDIRNCIDIVKPDSCIEVYSIEDSFRNIKETVGLENGRQGRLLHGRNVFEVDPKVNKIFSLACVDPEYRKIDRTFPMFFASLEYNLENQKAVMKKFQIIEVETGIQKKIGAILHGLDRPLRVKQMEIVQLDDECSVHIISHIDVKRLEKIEISRPYWDVEDNPTKICYISVDEVCELDQWKNADELIVKNFIITTRIQEMNVTNFAYLDITISTISTDDILYLKEKLLKSSNFRKFKIVVDKCHVEESLYDLMGPTYHRTEIVSLWCYNFSNSKELLRVRYDVTKAVTFTRFTD